MKKISWTWRDIVTELGLGAAVDMALLGGAAALGLGTGPIGWTLLAGAGISAAIWYFTRQMDNNLPDLIDRLEDLDPRPEYETKVQIWIDTLKKSIQSISAPPTTTDTVQRGQLNAQQYVAMRNLFAYMQQLEQEWRTDVYPNGLSDTVFDPGQANHAISETLSALKTSIEKMKAAAKQDSEALLAQIKEKSKVDYKQIATEIVGLYDQLTTLYGKAPQFESHEKHLESAFQFALNLSGRTEEFKSFSQQDLMAMLPVLNKLKDLFARALQPKPEQAKTSAQKTLSKRALILGDGSRISDTEPPPPRGQLRPGPLSTKSPTVGRLQMALNVINEIIKNPNKCVVDGIYGKQTAAAVISILEKSKATKEYIAKETGLTIGEISDPAFMNQNPQKIASLYETFYPLATKLKAQSENRTESDPEPAEESGAQCRPDKFTPTPAEIIACLKSELQIEEPNTGKRLYAYDWMKSLGVGDDTMVAWIAGLFPPGEYRSMDWSPAVLVEHVKTELAKNEKQPQYKSVKQSRKISVPTDDVSLLRYLKNYFEVEDPSTGEKMGAYFWLDGKGLDRYIMLKMINDFTRTQLGEERIWDTATTPRKFTAFVESMLGGREGGARII